MFAHMRSRHSNMSQAVDLTSYNDKHVCAIQFKRHKLVLCGIRCGRHCCGGLRLCLSMANPGLVYIAQMNPLHPRDIT